jgi:hypothetical protein
VLVRATDQFKGIRGRRWRSTATIAGWPVIDIAFGPAPERGERMGRPRGLIALGDQPVGGIAIGGFATGIVAIGGTGLGVCTIGGAAIGALTAVGGAGFGGFAVGGAGAGAIASASGAAGFISDGNAAAGYYARGQMATGTYTINAASGRKDPEAVEVFATLQPILGKGGMFSPLPLVTAFAVTLLVSSVILVLAALATRKASRRDEPRVNSRM